MKSARAISYAACIAIFGTFILTASQGVENATLAEGAPLPTAIEPRLDASPAPIMIGTPIFYDGPMAGRYPNAAWVSQINDALAIRGYQRIEDCAQRTQTAAFAYMVGCDGRFRFVSDIYKAAASMSAPIEEVSVPEPQIARKPGEKIPDIVDTTVPLRIKTYAAAHELAAAATSRHEVPIYGRSAPEPFVDPALTAAVPRVANRSAVPQLLPGTAVADPFPAIAGATAPAPRAAGSGTPTPAARPKVVTVEAPEKVDRPRLADFPAAVKATAAPKPVDAKPAVEPAKAKETRRTQARGKSESKSAAGKSSPAPRPEA